VAYDRYFGGRLPNWAGCWIRGRLRRSCGGARAVKDWYNRYEKYGVQKRPRSETSLSSRTVIQVYNDVEFQKLDTRFERGFCINVLSVIPSYSRRRKVLDLIQRKLKPDGECLFVVQYRNSDAQISLLTGDY
jgi:hypothetical protein